MATPGFAEQQAEYTADDPRKLVGQFRRLGPAGPAYEIMAVDDAGNVTVEIVYSDERLVYPLAEILEDPIAETIP
ncbi:MAG: DUF5397 family protein [Hyphomicrobiaceae bacterium]|nr:DUF5397 family protein [Hyphomicrobiaceae bacterium]